MTSEKPADFESLLEAYRRIERTLQDRMEELTDARQQLGALRGAATGATRVNRQFVANMSHELRTPMNGVLGMAELLNDTALTGEQREYIDVLIASVRALMRVVDDILDVSDIEAGRLELESHPFHLHRCVGDTLRLLAPAARAKGLELTLYVDPRLPEWVRGDLARFRQVLASLAGNAIKFTPAGGVAVEVRESAPGGADRRLLHVTVRDTGIGIPVERRQAIFRAVDQANPFSTRRLGGTGLGLAISRRLVELMGGRLWVDSAPGQGSAFQFTLAVEIAAGAPSLAHAYTALAGRRMLVIDDHAGARQALGLTLDACGVATTLVEQGAPALRAIEAARAEQRPFDVIVLDVPALDSELTRAVADLRSASSGTPLLAVGAPPDAVRCRELPVATFLAAPVQAPALLAAATSVLAPARAVESTWRAERRERFRGLTVLVAEDNPINQQVITLMLEGWGIAVTIAPSGRDVLAALDRAAFDAVFMDLQMPDGDGFQTTTAIRAREAGASRRVPIIALTAQREDRARCLAAGMDDYLSKPVAPTELADMLERATLSLGGEHA